jgi:hypothetical protein
MNQVRCIRCAHVMNATLHRIVSTDALECPRCERHGVTIPMCIERRDPERPAGKR